MKSALCIAAAHTFLVNIPFRQTEIYEYMVQQDGGGA